jgi:hypothetical protein
VILLPELRRAMGSSEKISVAKRCLFFPRPLSFTKFPFLSKIVLSFSNFFTPPQQVISFQFIWPLQQAYHSIYQEIFGVFIINKEPITESS